MQMSTAVSPTTSLPLGHEGKSFTLAKVKMAAGSS